MGGHMRARAHTECRDEIYEELHLHSFIRLHDVALN